MPETAGQHKAGRLRQSPDEDLRALLQCDPKHFVIGPHKRTYRETAAYVDQVRKTKRWRTLCEVFRQLARTKGDSDERANPAAVVLTVAQLIMEVTGAELDQVPRSWVTTYLGDDWQDAYLALGGQL
jgi:hypothetical protein